ncbi:hypothetical protein Tco_0414295 [Tanacetum coccineum]
MQNVENSFSGSNEQYAEIVRLKETLFEQVQEKDSLMKTVSDLKNDLKMEENRNIDREIALEKKIKAIDNYHFSKRSICATVHMMTKSKICYDHSTKQAIGFEKPFYLKKVRESKPKLYDGNVILKMDTVVIPNSDETLMLCEESRSKMLLKEQDPLVVKHRVNTKPINYAILNNDYNKRFVRQSDFIVEHPIGSLELKTELLNKKDFVDKETYDKLLIKSSVQHKDIVIVKLKEQIKSLNGNVDDSTVKMDMDEIETLNIELEHRITQEEALVLRDSGRTCKAKFPQDSLFRVAFRNSANTSSNSKKILQTPSSNSKNKVEAHPRNIKSSLNKRDGTVKVNGSAVMQNLKKQDNSDYVCINRDDCMSSDNLCVSNSMNDVKFRAKPKKNKSKKDIWKPTGKVFTQIGYIWKPTGRTFTIVGNACLLTRITTTNEVPSRKPIVLDSESPKPVVKLVYSRKPRKNKNTESVSKTKVVQIVLWYLDSGCSKHMTGDRSQLTNFISKFLGTVKFRNDQVAKIMGFGDYQIGNVTIPILKWLFVNTHASFAI